MAPILFGVVLILCSTATFALSAELPPRKCGRVHLTVSSSHDTYLEMNWITECDHPLDVAPDIIALYEKDPRERNERVYPKIQIYAPSYPSGYYRTKIKFGHAWLPGNWEYHENLTHTDPGFHCFPYWISSIKGEDIIDSKCLDIKPTWMNDNRDVLGPQRIESVFIPGTHNSGAYSQSRVPNLLKKYVLNQDRDVWTQLVFGIRYLDLRVAYYEDEGFFINHDLVQIVKLSTVLKQIRKFAELAPMEIIIVDFHRFPYPSEFTPSIHHKLVGTIYGELGHLVLSPNGLQAKGPTFKEIWLQNKSVIVCYATREVTRDYPFLWNPIQQFWGNTRSVDALKGFLYGKIQEHPTVLNPMWALMAELTPQPLDVLFGVNNLRKLADDVNRKVTMWFRDEWSRRVNIVATDFFLGNDLINVAIEANRNR